MPNQPPSDRTRAKGGQPVFNPALSPGYPPSCLLPIASCLYYAKRTQSHPHGTPKMQNEPNLPPHAWPRDPNSRNEPNLHPAIMQNEPNSPRPTANRQKPKAAFHETNPICRAPARPTNQMRKTNPISSPIVPHASIMRNKPNSRIPSVPPPHIYAKRTQSPLPFLLSPLYFRLSRGQQPAPPNLPQQGSWIHNVVSGNNGPFQTALFFV